jgi:hypothetical protein
MFSSTLKRRWPNNYRKKLENNAKHAAAIANSIAATTQWNQR